MSKETKQRNQVLGELVENATKLNTEGLNVLLLWALQCSNSEKYRRETSEERLEEIRSEELKKLKEQERERKEESYDHYKTPGILTEIGKRYDYMKVLDKNSPYYSDFMEILENTAHDYKIMALDCFALGCIATEKELKKKAKRAAEVKKTASEVK